MPRVRENLLRLSNIWNSSLPSSSGTESGPSVASNIQQAANQFKRINDCVYELRAGTNPKVDLVYFHGLPLNEDDASTNQAFWRIWTKRGSDECWPVTMLPECLAEQTKDDNPARYDPRVLAVSYKSRLELPPNEGNTATDEYSLSESLTIDLILSNEGVGQERPVILVGHDLGGILIKQLILFVEDTVDTERDATKRYKLNQFLKNLGSVFFYSTPHMGSTAIERVAREIPHETRNQMLLFMSVLSGKMSRVNAEFSTYRHKKKGNPRFATFALTASHLTNKGYFKGEVVCEEGSARNDIDTYYPVQADHYDVCRPEGTWSNSMKLLAQDILRVVDKFEKRVAGGTSPEFAGVRQELQGF